MLHSNTTLSLLPCQYTDHGNRTRRWRLDARWNLVVCAPGVTGGNAQRGDEGGESMSAPTSSCSLPPLLINPLTLPHSHSRLRWAYGPPPRPQLRSRSPTSNPSHHTTSPSPPRTPHPTATRARSCPPPNPHPHSTTAWQPPPTGSTTTAAAVARRHSGVMRPAASCVLDAVERCWLGVPSCVELGWGCVEAWRRGGPCTSTENIKCVNSGELASHVRTHRQRRGCIARHVHGQGRLNRF